MFEVGAKIVKSPEQVAPLLYTPVIYIALCGIYDVVST